MPVQEIKKRPPIVVVMGHVDHGKTTLLDYIKETSVAGREAGGITQSIGAYEVATISGQKITFIDTPGHQAFLAMRARGTKAADIALLVVAADDGVKEQTKESLKIINETATPYIVVINKTDKPGADIDKVMNDLAREGVMLEGRGGNISWKAISAKTGEGVPDLLDLILLTAEMEELTYDANSPASGYVLESKLDSRRGPVATLIIKDGVLRVGDEIFTNQEQAKIKLMEDCAGKKLDNVAPSTPVLVLGFSKMPMAGEEFSANSSRSSLQASPKAGVSEVISHDNDNQIINFVLRAGDSGSLEALETIITNIQPPEGYRIQIIDKAVGDISDDSIKTASATGASIIGFKVKTAKSVEGLAKTRLVKIIQSDIIYKLTEELDKQFRQMDKEIKIGELEVLAVFGKKANRQIIGGRVVEGRVANHSTFAIIRNEKEIADGKIVNLQSGKEDIQEIEAGSEGGLLVEASADIKAGDRLVI